MANGFSPHSAPHFARRAALERAFGPTPHGLAFIYTPPDAADDGAPARAPMAAGSEAGRASLRATLRAAAAFEDDVFRTLRARVYEGGGGAAAGASVVGIRDVCGTAFPGGPCVSWSAVDLWRCFDPTNAAGNPGAGTAATCVARRNVSRSHFSHI